MDRTVIDQITECVSLKKNFVLSGGAGSGKTYTLIQTLQKIFEINHQSNVVCITYTNVAANEIKKRSPYSKLIVSTIHDFLWNEIKAYQKNLKQVLVELIELEKEKKGSGITYHGEETINLNTIATIEYQNFRDLAKGIISHDEIIKIANYMFKKYPLLGKILKDKYDYVLIDEYQDTQKMVIEIFLDCLNSANTNKICIGFFGDKMQSIYENGVGDIQTYIDNGGVCEIKKEDNFRCAQNVINVLNNIRSDIKQLPAKRNSDGSIANNIGSVKFIYADNDFDLDNFKTSKYADGWDFDPNTTKILFLTHKLSANRLGFSELLSAYTYTDNLIGNEPDKLAKHLLLLGSIMYQFSLKNYALVLDTINYRVRNLKDKTTISGVLSKVNSEINAMNIETLIETFHSNRLLIKSDSLNDYIHNHAELYEKIRILPASQVLAYYKYYESYSPYSTQHGVKGAEFDNVLVVMDNGKWNNYNFNYYFENTSGKEKIIKRTERIFYVCCSRAIKNLIVYYPFATDKIIQRAKLMFGTENVLRYS